ncbi:unnamed protein product [Arabidopsis halleri]
MFVARAIFFSTLVDSSLANFHRRRFKNLCLLVILLLLSYGNQIVLVYV